jgi:V/A-type H+-transporting ATPase subunit F
MLKMAMVGDYLTAEVFSLTDFFVRMVRRGDDALEILEEISREGFQIIFITEVVAEPIMDELEKCKKRHNKLIVVIPGVTSRLGLGEKIIADLRRKVIGA